MKPKFLYSIFLLLAFSSKSYGADCLVVDIRGNSTRAIFVGGRVEQTFKRADQDNTLVLSFKGSRYASRSFTVGYTNPEGQKVDVMDLLTVRDEDAPVSPESIFRDVSGDSLDGAAFVSEGDIFLTASTPLNFAETLLSWGPGRRCVIKASEESPSHLREIEFLTKPGSSTNVCALFGIIDFSKSGINFLPSSSASVPEILRHYFTVMGADVKLTYRMA